ncbi:CLUMA_CG004766, isoform A [Clunio marinus]|uniref:CLUMA_CG004766, isoform A n=1 Tax=Clunio marinus TaxID=568069 RepID=A0A1J1HX28_9DIPT|nr:CLUMA_CG004766, isoform A [Clunio marinus]
MKVLGSSACLHKLPYRKSNVFSQPAVADLVSQSCFQSRG